MKILGKKVPSIQTGNWNVMGLIPAGTLGNFFREFSLCTYYLIHFHSIGVVGWFSIQESVLSL